MGKRHYRQQTRYPTPKKGTKARGVLLGILSPTGMTTREGIERGVLTRQSDMAALLSLFTNVGGWDIRGFHEPTPPGMTPMVRYRIVGRLRWNGGYRSLVRP